MTMEQTIAKALKESIIKALKQAREGKGTLSLRDIAEILKEVLSEDEIISLIVYLENRIK